MKLNLDRVMAKARLLLAAVKLQELFQWLQRDVPTLIAEVEQLQRELAEAKRGDGRPHLPPSEVSLHAAKGPGESQLLTSKQFAYAIGVSEAYVRTWTLERKIKVVRLGRLVRIPRTEVQRLIDEGAIPVGPSRSQPQ